MLDYIEQLRKKPVAYRKRFLLVFTTTITGIIFMIWATTFDFNLSPSSSPVVEDGLGPISEIETNVSSFFTTVKKLGSEMFGGESTTSPSQK